VVDKKAEALKIVEDKVEVLPSFSRAEHEEWFDGNIQHYKTLAAVVAATLKSTLDGHGISYVDIPYREKEKKSFLKKIDDKNKKKDYSPDNMTDLAGIRVITLIESDVEKVGELIHSLFNVHPEDSINKSASLGEDKVGYRSIHFVCDIGETREGLLEWKALKGLCFEIQVRTALEHAWAEIEHDRGYKLGGKLPSHLSRRFSLLSGLLESADLEFNRLTVEIEEYAKNLNNEIKENNDLDIELTSIGINTLIEEKYSHLCAMDIMSHRVIHDIELLEELKAFGLETLKDLHNVIESEIGYFPTPNPSFNDGPIGFLRDVMLLNDIDKYFNFAWKVNYYLWYDLDSNCYNLLIKKYGASKIHDILSTHNINVINSI